MPFYAGLTLDEIGGDGVRWQDRDAASALPAAELSTEPLAEPPAPPDGLVLAGAPTLWTGPEVEYSPSLRFLATGERAWLSVEDARRLGVKSGDEVELSVNGDRLSAVAIVRTGRARGQRLPLAARARGGAGGGPLTAGGRVLMDAGSRARSC